MGIIKLLDLPFLSTDLIENGLYVVNTGYHTRLYFQFCNQEDDDLTYNFQIEFDAIQAQRFSSEKFTLSILDSYDSLVEITNSEWVEHLKLVNEKIALYWQIKHYAIYIDSYGLYEFIARGYKVSGISKGEKTWII